MLRALGSYPRGATGEGAASAAIARAGGVKAARSAEAKAAGGTPGDARGAKA